MQPFTTAEPGSIDVRDLGQIEAAAPDKTQDMLNHMAKVQIEATIKHQVNNELMMAKAKRMNEAGVTILQAIRRDCMEEVSYPALCAAFGSPPRRPAPTVH